jgi:hypothetical protein
VGSDCNLYGDQGIQKEVAGLKIDNEGAKKLATGISILAVEDLNITYKKTMKLHKVCCKNGKCDTEQLINYLVKFAEKRNYISLPFREHFEYSALEYFSNHWGNQLLDAAGISYLPKDFKDRLELLWSTYNKCRPCITRCIKDAELRVENGMN